MSPHRIAGLLALAAFAACQPAPETPEQRSARLAALADSARAGIEAQLALFERWAPAGQFDSVAMLYTADAVIMPPNTPSMGRDSMQAALAAGGPFTIDFNVVSVWSDGSSCRSSVSRGTSSRSSPCRSSYSRTSEWAPR